MNVNLEKFAPMLIDVIKRAMAPRDQRVAALEAKVAELETKQLPTWAGVHEKGKSYGACSLVTRDGGLWLATTATDTTPGQGATPWKLVVKRGETAFRFKSGAIVQDDDGTWIAERETSDPPGASDDWRRCP